MDLKRKLSARLGAVGRRVRQRVAPLVSPARDEGEPPHLCHLLPQMDLGGDAGQVVNISNHLNPDDFLVSCLCVERRGRLAQRVEPRVQVWALHRHEPLCRAAVADLVRCWRRYGVELVHTHGLDTFVWGTVAARLAGVRRVVHTEHRVGQAAPKVPPRLKRLAVQWCDRFAATSRRAAEQLAESLDIELDSVRIIPRGVNSEAFRPPPGREDARVSLGMEQDELLVGSLARLGPGRGYETVLEALALLLGEGLPLRALLLGEGEARPALEAKVEALGLTGRVELPGFAADVAALLPLMDIFVQPFGAAGTSAALLEAMASATAVVAVHEGGNPELVWDGDSGVLVPPGDAEALAHTLRELAVDPERRAELGRNARTQVLRQHQLQLMADRYADLYQEALGPSWQDEGMEERIRRATAGLRGMLAK